MEVINDQCTIDNDQCTINNEHKLFNNRTLIAKLNNNEFYYKVNSRNILSYVRLWKFDKDFDESTFATLRNQYQQYPELIYICEINGEFINYYNLMRLVVLNSSNIEIICYVRYNSHKSDITKLIYEFNKREQNTIKPITHIQSIIINKESLISMYPNHFTKDKKNTIDCNIDEFYDKLVNLISDEVFNNDETIKRICRFYMPNWVTIFNKINNTNKELINTKYYKNINNQSIVKAIKFDCYIFILPIDNKLLLEYFTDELKKRYKECESCCGYYNRHKLQTRSLTIDNVKSNNKKNWMITPIHSNIQSIIYDNSYSY